MSYEPRIIIKKTDLEPHEQQLRSEYGAIKKTDDKEAIEYLGQIYKESSSCFVFDMELILFHVELTSFNKRIRKLLDKWNIEYGEF